MKAPVYTVITLVAVACLYLYSGDLHQILFSQNWSTTQQGSSTITWIRAENSDRKLAVSVDGGSIGLGVETGLLSKDTRWDQEQGRQVTLRVDHEEPFAASVMPLRDRRFYWSWEPEIFGRLLGRDRLTVRYTPPSGHEQLLKFDISGLETQLQSLGISASAIAGQIPTQEDAPAVLIR